MDDAELLKVSGFSASTIAVVLIVYRLLKTITGKKIVSNCCGKKVEVGVAVAEMTPKCEETVLEIRNPIQKNSQPSVEPDVRTSS